VVALATLEAQSAHRAITVPLRMLVRMYRGDFIFTCLISFIDYYQCVPGTATTSATSTSKTSFSTTTSTTSTSTSTSTTLKTTTSQTATQTSTSSAAATCTGTFNAISASDFVAKLHPGWNLGNTLDATPDEGSWNNAPVVASTFSDVQKAGFKSVRIPGKLSFDMLRIA
jgi:endoglucanase